MKRTLYYLFFLVSIFSFMLRVDASNRINSIDMDIYIDRYGDAEVVEVWDTYLDSGTEGFRSFSKMEGKTITDFVVSDDTGRTYSYLYNWNTNMGFDYKTYKNGINYINDGLELCWGISNYGNRIYTLKYKIKGFVTKYIDKQGIYFNLLNLDQSVGDVTINISSYNGLNINNSKIWGFGYKGDVIFQNNNIVMNSNGRLSSNEYMVLLVRFEDDYYNTSNSSYKSFDTIYEEAMKGVDKKKSNPLNFIFELHPIVFIIVILILSLLLRYLLAFVLTILSSFLSNLFPDNNYEFEYSIKKLKKNKNINYYRDIPCNKDLELSYFILNKLNIVKTKELKKSIIGAYILKWLYLGYINVDKEKNLIINKDIYNSLHKKELSLDSESETKLYMILYQAGGDNILNPKEFKVWSKKCYKILNKWYCDLLINKRSEIESLIVNSYKKSLFGKIYYKEFGDYLMNEAYNLIGLKKFLLDFSRVKDRGLVEVEIWEYYLIYATLFGISDKIDIELKEMYPDLNIESYIRYTEILKMIDDYSSSSYRGMKTSINNENFQQKYTDILEDMYSGSDNYSGGGGSSFSSGGSSSGGSSGGGFR